MLGSRLKVCEGCVMAASHPFWLRAEACNPAVGLDGRTWMDDLEDDGVALEAD